MRGGLWFGGGEGEVIAVHSAWSWAVKDGGYEGVTWRGLMPPRISQHTASSVKISHVSSRSQSATNPWRKCGSAEFSSRAYLIGKR